MTIESEIASLTTATTKLLDSVNVQKSYLDNAVTSSTAQANAAMANANTASGTNTVVQTALAGTTSAAAQAANARDKAIAASQVATAVNESLAAMSQTLHSGNIVKMFPYDTAKDSDGGAWIQKARGSWFSETLGGNKWGGQAVNELIERGDNLISNPEGSVSTLASVSNVTDASMTINGYAAAIQYGDNSVVRSGYRTGSPGANIVTAFSIVVQMDDGNAPVVGLTSSTGDFSAVMFGNVVGVAPTVVNLGGGRYQLSMIGSAAAGNSFGIVKYTTQSARTFRATSYKTNAVGVLPSTYSASPELVSNGDFSNGTGGWILANAGMASVSTNGAVRLTNDSSGTYTGIRSPISTVIGKVYSVTCDSIPVNGVTGALQVGQIGSSGANGSAYGNGSASQLKIVFTATAVTTYVYVGMGNSTNGSACEFDNVSCKEVTVLATPYVPYSALAGTVYQNTTDGKFYSLNAAYGQTEVFRGISREFPATSMIVAESGRVIIYDTSVVGCPMWMVYQIQHNIFVTEGTISSLAAVNGQVFVGKPRDVDTAGLVVYNFVADQSRGYRRATYGTSGEQPIARKAHPLAADWIVNGSFPGLVSSIVNDIAVTVLDNAPVDPATGLKVPTIAVATNGGISVIKDDGTVVNKVLYSATSWAVKFKGAVLIVGGVSNDSWYGGYTWDFIANTITNYGNTAIVAFAINESNQKISSSDSYLIGSNSKNLRILKDNPSSPTKGMVAAITNAYSSGWQVGDSRLTTLADTVAETITASGELVINGTFDVDTAGWTANNSTLSLVAGKLRITNNGGNYGTCNQAIPTVIGKSYILKLEASNPVGTATLSLAAQFGTGANISASQLLNGVTIVATVANTVLGLQTGSIPAGDSVDFDNISVKLAVPDRSVKNNGLILNGTLTKAPVAAGANLVAYSGFSAANYLEQPYNPALDFGTGDFCVMGWYKYLANGDSTLLYRAGDLLSSSPVNGINIWAYCDAASNQLKSSIGGVNLNSLSTTALSKTDWQLVTLYRSAGVVYMYLGPLLVGSSVNNTSLSLAGAFTRLGSGIYSNSGQILALWRISATAPSVDQIAHIYRTELPLFQPGAQCTIDGNSSAITAMTFDDSTDLLQVGTSWGRSAFKDLLRVESEVSTIGALTSISASNGVVSVASATSSKTFQPSMSLRSEIKKRIEAARAIGKILSPVEFDTIGFNATTAVSSNSITAVAVTTGTPYIGMGVSGTGIPAGTTIVGISGTTYTLSAACTAAGTGVLIGQTTFSVPKGHTVKTVYAGELRKREGTTKAWTRSFDGFVEYINFAVSPGNAVWVSILMARSN